jgi:hypothetical protein
MAETLPDINIDITVLDRDHCQVTFSTMHMRTDIAIPTSVIPVIIEALKQAREQAFTKLVTQTRKQQAQ